MKLLTIEDTSDEEKKILLTKTQEVNFPLSVKTQKFIAQLKLAHKKLDGVGLAANQIGYPYRILIIEITPDIVGLRLQAFNAVEETVFINPHYQGIAEEGLEYDWESCFSIRTQICKVARFRAIRFKAQNESGAQVEFIVRGFYARLLQHEVDHLDGVLASSRVDASGEILSIEEAQSMRRKFYEHRTIMRTQAIFGRDSDELGLLYVHPELKLPLHGAIIEDVLALKRKANEEGILLKVSSGYRSYERQCKIWNEKVLGTRPVFNRFNLEQQIDVHNCDRLELLFNILHFSAIPGLSRHHWGTDFDVVAEVPNDLRAKTYKLIPSEFMGSGVFAPLGKFLDQHLPKAFYRPYLKSPMGLEPWHLSHKQVSRSFSDQYTFEMFLDFIKDKNEILLHQEILDNAQMIYQNYFEQYFL